MSGTTLRLLGAGAVAACLSISSFSASNVIDNRVAADLTVHEWGTFTSVAGPEGTAVEWLPLTGSTDLPRFVEHFEQGPLKCGIGGTIRMETPVVYFYSPREIAVSANVSFSKGRITEWYPHAAATAPASAGGSIRWDNVHLVPGSSAALPSESAGNHYYAARETAATPVRVETPTGDQNEKFLFYRGVSSASMPIAARLTPAGQVLVENQASEDIPAAMLIESRGGKFGYRLAGAIHDRFLVEPAPLTSSQDVMLKDLESILIARGLYVDEARAMIATWQNSWFEEGSRLLYLLPASSIKTLLPLAVRPSPASTVRVFVGRLELVTPATEKAVEHAFAVHDQKTLDKYHRFLEPILTALISAAHSDLTRVAVLSKFRDSVYQYACRAPWPDQP